ncbi:hypothetical protein I656_02517 [Geobacillus sp. WSUCF1]|nr:hypothetical protein I656_02517 [Geobacillus sp. WSUCF1]
MEEKRERDLDKWGKKDYNEKEWTRLYILFHEGVKRWVRSLFLHL